MAGDAVATGGSPVFGSRPIVGLEPNWLSPGFGQVLTGLLDLGEIDLTVAHTFTLYPAVPGKYFLPGRAPMLIFINTVKAGALSTAGNTEGGNIGSPGQNFLSAAGGVGTLSATVFNLGVGGMFQLGTGSNYTNVQNAAVTFTIVTPPTGTGGFAWKARLLVIGTLV